MDIKSGISLASVEGLAFTIGREGHIYISDPSVSRQHAEIKFIDGRIRLRDLNSTNGIYLVRGKKLVHFQEGYVKPQQLIVMGRKRYVVKSLLAVLGIFAEYADDTGLKLGLANTIKPIEIATSYRL